MAKRRGPAVFDRALGEWQPQPQVNDFVAFQEAVATAKPVIAFRYGRGVLELQAAYGYPYFESFSFTEEAAAAAANPVIAFRARILSELATEPLPEGSHPRHLRFPYLDASLFPASPVPPFRYGHDILRDLEAEPWRHARFERFPYLDASLFPAYPVPGFRYGRMEPGRPEAFVAPQVFPFPHFEQAAPAPANPNISFRYGRDLPRETDSREYPKHLPYSFTEEAAAGPANPVIRFRQARIHLQPPEAFVLPQSSFAFFSTTPPPPANPVVRFIRGQWIGDETPDLDGARPRFFPLVTTPPAFRNIPIRVEGFEIDDAEDPDAARPWAHPRFQRFPYFEHPVAPANPVIAFRYGRVELQRPEAFIAPEFLPFPYFNPPPIAPANPVVGFRYGRTELQRSEAFVMAQHMEFPYFSSAPVPSVALKSRTGSSVGLGIS